MKKSLQNLILIILILYIKNGESCLENDSFTSGNECRNLAVTSRGNYCCFVKGKIDGKNFGSCLEIMPWEYKDIKNHIEEMNKQAGYSIKSIDCESFKLKLKFANLAYYLLISILLF